MFEYSFTVREVHPFMSSLVNRAIVGVCVCVCVRDHRRDAELWVVPGSQDEELSDALLPLLPVHTLLHHSPLAGEYDKGR